MDAVRVCRAEDVWARGVDGAVDEEGGFVEHFDAAVVEDGAEVVHAEEVGFRHEVEVEAEGCTTKLISRIQS